MRINQRLTGLHTVLAIGILSLIACTEDSPLPGVIFPAETAQRSAVSGPGPGPESSSYWTPSESEVRDLEAELPAFLSTHWPTKRRPHMPLQEYRRQYFGVQHSGSKLIYVNAFCKGSWSQFPEWETRRVVVVDGDICFFQVFYNPSTHKFEDLSVNSWASTPPNKALQLTSAPSPVASPLRLASLASGSCNLAAGPVVLPCGQRARS